MVSRPGPPRRMGAAYLVLAVALLLTGSVTALVARAAAAKDRLRFENAVQHARDSIQSRLENYVSLLRATAGLFAADPSLDRAEFHEYVNRLHLPQRYAGVQGIGYSRRFRWAERGALVARLRREGAVGFHLWPASPGPEHHAILYLEPLDRRNRHAIGYDMFTEATRRAAMERARDTGMPAASGKLTLVQEIDPQKQAGFLLDVPLYRQGAPLGSVAARRRALEGFVYSPFRAGDLLEGIFGTERHPRVQFQVFDGGDTTPEHRLYGAPPAVYGRGYRPRFTTTTTLDVAGRRWSIVFATRPDFELSAATTEAPLTLLAGLLISGLLFGITAFQVRAREAAEAAEETLREREEQLRLITDAVPALIAYVDADGRYRFNNRVYEEWFQQPRAGIWGTRVRDLMDAAVYERIRPHVEAALAGEEVSFEARFQYPDSGERYVSAVYVPHRAAKGDVLGFVVLISDITTRRQAEIERDRLYQEAQEARQAAETASRLKDEFLATVSHELRTPLNAILGYAQLLRRRPRAPEEMARGLEAIERNVKAQAQLINDLLDVSRIVSGKLRLSVQPVNLFDVIEAAVEAVTPAAAAREIELRCSLPPPALFVSGDPNRLLQVVWNLLSNAIKFTAPGGSVSVAIGQTAFSEVPRRHGDTEGRGGEGATGREGDRAATVWERKHSEHEHEHSESGSPPRPVTPSPRHPLTPSPPPCLRGTSENMSPHWAVVTVRDTGIGIPPEFLPHVFDRFRQGDSSTTRRHGGLGLGLAIVRHLVELHGGTVRAESAGERQGACFTVTLPLPARGPGSGRPAPERAEDRPAAPARPRLEGVRVLVVDDEPDARELLAQLLQEAGAAVTTAGSAQAALLALEPERPDVLLSDIGMPDEDGYALLRQVRARPPERGGRIPAAALTAFARPEDRRRALDAGFQAHLPKPIEPEAVLTLVAELAGTGS